MKKLLHTYNFYKVVPAIFLLMSFFGKAKAQGAPEQECPNAISVCQPVYSQSNAYTTFGATQELNATNAGCLGSLEKNDVWYVLNTTTAGVLSFTITPNNLNDDYDWALWEVGNQGCQAIYNGLAPIRCNYSGTPGLTGMSSTITGSQWSASLNVAANSTYILNVSQFSSSTAGYTLDFSTSTTSIYDTVKPKMINVFTKCSTVSDSLTITTSEPIKCSSIAQDGSDFYLTPAAGTPYTAVGSNCIAATASTNNFTIRFPSILPAGTYWLHVKNGTDNNTLLDNCGNMMADSIQFTMVPPTPPVFKAIDTPACIRVKVVFDRGVKCSTVASDGSDFSISGPSPVNVTSAQYTCDANGLTDSIDLTFSKSIDLPGLYTLSVVVGTDTNAITDTCGQVVTDHVSWTVTDRGYIQATVTPDLICDPGYINLYSTVSFPSSAEGYDYKWTPSYLVADSTADTTTAYINQPYTTFQIQMTDSNYCYRRDTGHVLLSIRYPQILHTLADTALCVGYSAPLEAAGGVSYLWSPADGLSCTTCTDPIATPLYTTTYTVTISDIYGCSDDTSRTITVYQLPQLDAVGDTTVQYHTPVQLYANAPAGVYYYWEPITGLDNPNIVNPVAMPEITTEYTVRVADTNGCQSFDSLLIHIVNNAPVVIPNAFTPNGDGKNDLFRVGNVYLQTITEFRIFNRWGKEVFSTSNIKDGWDGTYKGVAQPMGVYNYIIRVMNPDTKKSQTVTGNVTLIR